MPGRVYSFAILIVENEAAYDGMADLTKRFGILPQTITLKGPTGSVFYFFTIPPGTKKANMEIAPGVRFRTDGEYDGLLPQEFLDQVQKGIK